MGSLTSWASVVQDERPGATSRLFFSSIHHMFFLDDRFSPPTIRRWLGDDSPLDVAPIKRLRISAADPSSQKLQSHDVLPGATSRLVRQEDPAGPEAQPEASVLTRDGGVTAAAAAHDPPPLPTAAAELGAGADATPASVSPTSAGDNDIAVTDTARDLRPPQSVASLP